MIAQLSHDLSGLQGALVLFFAFAIFHALGDFGLQGEFLSRAKNRGADLSDYFKDGAPPGVWFHALLSHSLIHAGGVWLVSGSVVLAFAELVLHSVIDHVKGSGLTSFSTDQLLHYLCKLIYVGILILAPGLLA